MSKRILTYNGIDLSTFKAHVSGEGAWVKPAPEYERISVPGRSGDVLLYNGRYSNVDIKYRFGITENFDTNYTNLIAALLGSPGYHKLVDSKHPGVYRMAAIDKGIEPTMLPQLSAGEFEVTFNCKPQVFYDSGDEQITLFDGGTRPVSRVTNNTACDCHPGIFIATTSRSSGSYSSAMLRSYNRGGSLRRTYIIEIDSYQELVWYDSESGNFYGAYASGEIKRSRIYNEYCRLTTRYPPSEPTPGSEYNEDVVIVPGGYLELDGSTGTGTYLKKVVVTPRFCTL